MEQELDEGGGDETIRLAPIAAERSDTPARANLMVLPRPSPFKTPAPVESSSVIAGVECDAEFVKPGIAKIQSTMPELLRQGLQEGQEVPDNAVSTM